MAWTAPRTWATGELVTAAMANEQWRDNLKALAPISHTEFTGNVACTATAEASADVIVTAPAFTADGAQIVEVEFYAPMCANNTSAEGGRVFLFLDGNSIGILWRSEVAGTNPLGGISAKRRLTPASGSRTYSIRGCTKSGGVGTFTVSGGNGGSGALMPGYIRIRAVG